MSLQDEIYKPIVKIVPIEGSGEGLPANCFFQVEVNFKEIDGVLPYPPLKYPSTNRPILSAQNSPDALMEALSDKIENHKQYCDFLKEKQGLVDSFLTTMWGA